MEHAARTDREVIRGALNIADDIRDQLVKRGRRREDITLAWFPDPNLVPTTEAPELKAILSDTTSVRQMFSREELAVSSRSLDRDSVVAKINLVVESLHAGLP